MVINAVLVLMTDLEKNMTFDGSHKTVPIHDREIVLGKCPDCDIALPPALMGLHYIESHGK